MANLSIWEVPKVSVYYMVNPMIFLVVEDRSCWWFVRFRDHDGKRKRPNCWCFQMFVIFTPILEKKWSNLTHIFQMVWFKHHLELVGALFIGAINWFPVGRTNARAWVVEILPTKVPVDGLYKFCSSACVTTPKKNGKKTSSQLLQKRNMLVSGIMSLYRRGELVLNSFHQDYSTYSSYVASLDVFHFSHPPQTLSLISDRNGGGKETPISDWTCDHLCCQDQVLVAMDPENPMTYLPQTNSSSLKMGRTLKGQSSSNYYFSGTVIVAVSVYGAVVS